MLEPDVGGHDLVLLVDIEKLGEAKFELDRQQVAVVSHRPDQFVVAAEKILKESSCLRIALKIRSVRSS